jgi:hypothetical protein
MKLILLINVIPLDFNASIPAFHKFLIPSEKKMVATLSNFAPRQFYSESSPQMRLGCIITNRRVKFRICLGKRSALPMAKIFKSQPAASKTRLTNVWYVKGANLVHFTPEGEIINSQNYCDVLQKILKPAIRSKRRRKL